MQGEGRGKQQGLLNLTLLPLRWWCGVAGMLLLLLLSQCGPTPPPGSVSWPPAAPKSQPFITADTRRPTGDLGAASIAAPARSTAAVNSPAITNPAVAASIAGTASAATVMASAEADHNPVLSPVHSHPTGSASRDGEGPGHSQTNAKGNYGAGL